VWSAGLAVFAAEAVLLALVRRRGKRRHFHHALGGRQTVRYDCRSSNSAVRRCFSISAAGPLVVCTPGSVAGYAEALWRWGTLDWAEAIAPALAEAKRWRCWCSQEVGIGRA
jgi:hypothetical protein